MKTISLLLAGALLCSGSETRSWTQSGSADFQKGNLTNLSIRSDGRLSLAPHTSEIYDSSTAYLWTLAQDSRGNLYTAGGPGARLFRVSPDGKGTTLAEFDALEIHAIAVDSKDHIYVATAPDGKVYRVGQDGKTEEFYNPKQKYIWAMICDSPGNLYVATGDQGEVHRVTPAGKGEVFFKTDESHARALAIDHAGNLIVGTEPGGLVIRVSPKGEGFVLYQMSKREVTALAVGPRDEIYAAAVGSKTGSSTITQPAAPPAPAAPAAPAASTSAAIVLQPVTPAAVPPPPAARAPVNIPGGSDVYRISAKEAPEKIWSGAQDVVYSLAVDRDGRVLIGSGNKGELYRVETRVLYSTLASFPVAQLTALMAAKDGSLYVATGNVGKLFRAGPDLEHEGSIESDVYDTGGFSNWGRLSAGGDLHSGRVTFTTRSGNVDRPQQNWSPWSQATNGLNGGQIKAPPARFLQWKATLAASASKTSPTLDSVEAAYLRQNVAPKIDQIEITPFNYKFPAPSTSTPLASPLTLTLPAIGTRPAAPHAASDSSATPAMQYSKGALGVRWSAADDNGDTLEYTVEIRAEKDKSWKTLRDKLHEKYFSFDSTAFPDGDYRIRITASDSPSNTPDNTLQAQEESDPFTIDNTPPKISAFTANRSTAKWHAEDELSLILKAEYSLDGGDWTVVDPVTKLSDSQALDYSLALKNLGPGEHTLAVRVTDENENGAIEKIAVR